MKKIAFVGSRNWQDAQRVAIQVNECFKEHGAFIIVSGGADGASHTAEQTGMEFGFPVISFRTVQIQPGEFGVDEWRLYRGRGDIVRHEITWATWASAAWFRGLLIAERADEGFAYWDGYSRGCAGEIDAFTASDTKLTVANLRLEQGGRK